MAKKLVYTTNTPGATTDYPAADGTWKTIPGGGPGGGTVTSIGTIAPITGGTITTSGAIGITQASGSTDGYVSASDWNTFNSKQNAVSLTTTGTSGSSSFNPTTGALNIPVYAGAGSGTSIQTIIGSTTGLGAGTTRYGTIIGTTAEGQVSIPIPQAITINNLYVRTTATMPVNSSLQVTLVKNGTTATSLSVTIPAGSAAGIYSDTTNNATYSAGDRYQVEFKNSGSATAAPSSGQSFKITI